jgi:hypothetical protein
VATCADKGGSEEFYDFLLKRDLAAFDPYAPPPMTAAKTALIDLGRPNPERFYLAWQAGDLPVPYVSCSAAQAYRAYKRWAQLQGEKFTSASNYFSRQVLREAKDGISVRKARVGTGNGQTVNLWCVATPHLPEGVTMHAYAEETVRVFDGHLADYLGDQA